MTPPVQIHTHIHNIQNQNTQMAQTTQINIIHDDGEVNVNLSDIAIRSKNFCEWIHAPELSNERYATTEHLTRMTTQMKAIDNRIEIFTTMALPIPESLSSERLNIRALLLKDKENLDRIHALFDQKRQQMQNIITLRMRNENTYFITNATKEEMEEKWDILFPEEKLRERIREELRDNLERMAAVASGN